MKKLILFFLVAGTMLLLPAEASAQYTLLNSCALGSSDGYTVTCTLDTTGADFVDICGVDWEAVTASTFGSSKAGTYTQLTQADSGTGNDARVRLWFCRGCTFGTSHAFTLQNLSNQTFPAVIVRAWSGSAATPADQQNQGNNSGSGTTVTGGSVTPTENNELITNCTGHASTFVSIGSGFTATDGIVDYNGTNFFGATSSYLVQGTAGALNPTVTTSGSEAKTGKNATFKAGAATEKGGAYLRRRRN